MSQTPKLCRHHPPPSHFFHYFVSVAHWNLRRGWLRRKYFTTYALRTLRRRPNRRVRVAIMKGRAPHYGAPCPLVPGCAQVIQDCHQMRQTCLGSHAPHFPLLRPRTGTPCTTRQRRTRRARAFHAQVTWATGRAKAFEAHPRGHWIVVPVGGSAPGREPVVEWVNPGLGFGAANSDCWADKGRGDP